MKEVVSAPPGAESLFSVGHTQDYLCRCLL